MKLHFSFRKTTDDCNTQLESYVTEKKLNRLTSLLGEGNLDLADLNIRMEYLLHHNSFMVKIDLKIARHFLVAEETSHSFKKAFDLALDKIVAQLRKVESIGHHK